MDKKKKEALVKKKKDPKPATKGSLLDNVELAITTELVLNVVQLKDMCWQAKLTIKDTLPETHRHYRVALTLNEQPFLDNIDRINSDLTAGLFKDDPSAKKNAQKQVERIENDLEKNRELCQAIEFNATVFEMKYVAQGTQITVQIPDNVIDPINKQKSRLGKLYKIRLEPTSL